MAATPPEFLKTEADLRAVLPAPGERIRAKIRTDLEATARAWIGASRLVALATRREDGRIDMSARARSFAAAGAPNGDRILVIDEPVTRLGAPWPSDQGRPAGGLFMLPGTDSTIRANGRARSVAGGDAIEVQVAEAYMHCPKAFVRSKLWHPAPAAARDWTPESGAELGAASRAFLEASPFLFLGTALADGGADVSPRGDPPGFVRIVDERTLLIPDRPGNRIADSFRNLLDHPFVGLLCLIPGTNWALRIAGAGHVVSDPAWLAPLAERNRVPALGIWVDVERVDLEPAPALGAARIWDVDAHDAAGVPSVGRAIVEQVDRGGSLLAAKGKVLDWMLARDAKKNLY